MKKSIHPFVILFLLVWGMTSTSFAQIAIGDKVENFELKNIDGKHYSLRQYASQKGVILIFDSNICPFSKKYNSRIKALHDKYSSKNFQLILINSNDAIKSPENSFEKMIIHAKEHGYNFPYLHDATQKMAHYFGATNTPHVFILESKKEGFFLVYKGGIDNNYEDENDVTEKYVENALQNVINNEPVKVPTTKALGCTIKWK